MRTLVRTFGCKVNYAESVAACEALAALGVDAHAYSAGALGRLAGGGAVLVNTCCVTKEAERKALQFVRKLRREYPDVSVLATGCGARLPVAREKLVEAGARVFGQYSDLIEVLLADAEARSTRGAADSVPVPGGRDARPTVPNKTTHRARAFIKVQDGCCCHCSYCIIPQVRPFTSRAPEDVYAEVRQRLAGGYRELVLTGINIGAYGLAPLEGTPVRPPHGFTTLLAGVLELIPAGARLRLSSIEPPDLTDGMFELLAHPRLCPHLHVPLQSGSDAVLKAMDRKYTVAQYIEAVARFRRLHPNGSVTTDILVGFPGETEADFAQTLRVCTEAGFERVHGFPFSPRPGTPAAKMPGLPRRIVQQRNRELIAHCARIADSRWQRFVGSVMDVLIEERVGELMLGHGPAYQVVHVAGECRPGQVVPVRLEAYADGGFRGPALPGAS